MAVNGEAIYGTRPWKIFGEGPSLGNEEKSGHGHIANAVKDVRKYRPGDLRFTAKGKTIYTFCMERPEGDIRVKALGLKNADVKKVSSVKLLGGKGKIDWTQTDDELIIRKPSALPNFTTLVFAVK